MAALHICLAEVFGFQHGSQTDLFDCKRQTKASGKKISSVAMNVGSAVTVPLLLTDN